MRHVTRESVCVLPVRPMCSEFGPHTDARHNPSVSSSVNRSDYTLAKSSQDDLKWVQIWQMLKQLYQDFSYFNSLQQLFFFFFFFLTVSLKNNDSHGLEISGFQLYKHDF